MPIVVTRTEAGFRPSIRCDRCGAAIEAGQTANALWGGPAANDQASREALPGPVFLHKGCDEASEQIWGDWAYETLDSWLAKLVANSGVDRTRFEAAAWGDAGPEFYMGPDQD